MAFAGAQVFYLDSALVKGAATASIDRIDLYFKSKPQATNNKSGIVNPGVQLFLAGTANGVPVIPHIISNLRWSRVEYNNINISTDASLATTFRFTPPVPFVTGQNLALVLQYDGDEDFVPWIDAVGQYLVGTTTVSTGPKTAAVGGYFSYISGVPLTTGNNTTNTTMVSVGTTPNTGVSTANASYAASAWSPKVGTALKFSVYVARYTVNGDTNLAGYTNPFSPTFAQIQQTIAITNTALGETTFLIPQERYEYLLYDRVNSSISNISAGERVFPILPLYPPGQAVKVTLACTNGSNVVFATGNVNFSTLMNITGNQPENIVILSANALGANADIVNVRQVTSILSNTSLQLDQSLNFTNTVATFWRAPIATVDQFKVAKFFGNTADMVICKDSTANSTMFFAPYTINAITINGGGTGYSNTDWVNITGHSFLAGKVLAAYNANANIITNGSGVITAVYLANVGAHFSNAANVSYVMTTSGGANSTGTGANLSFTIGTNIKGEFLGFNGKGGNFANVRATGLDVGQTMPGLLASVPAGSYYNASLYFPYYSVDDPTTPTGRQLYCDVSGAGDTLPIKPFSVHQPYEFTKRRTLPSWSQELYVPYANGSSSQGFGGTANTPGFELTSNATVLNITTVSNNDFNVTTIVPVGSKVTFSRYIVNNDYTAENTNYGNAWARGIETQFNLNANTLAEDLLVYATVYMPANTNVLCFAKIYNTQDNDAFDSKDWTMMQLRNGNNVVSSPTNFADTYELTWGFQQYPNTVFTINGTVTTTSNSVTLTGSNTNFSNLVSGDAIVLVNGLFPNLYMVAVANVITNATSMTINRPVSNLNLVGSGFTVSKLGYKYQAFNNGLNDNVVRYYSSTMTENDGFNTCAIKLVMLSANGLSVPLIGDVRATALSA